MASIPHDYSGGLEAVPPAEGLESTRAINYAHNYPEVVPNSSHYPEVMPNSSHYPEVVPNSSHPQGGIHNEKVPVYTPPDENNAVDGRGATICGLRKRTFWIVVAVVVFVVVAAAAIGGGVGGSKSANSKSTASSPQSSISTTPAAGLESTTTPSPSQTSSSAPITSSSGTTSAQSALSTTPSPSKTTGTSSTSTTFAQDAFPTTRFPLDCPALNDTFYQTTSSDAPGHTYTFNILCNANFGILQDSSVKNTTSLDDCIQSCADMIADGAICVGVVWDSIINLGLTPRKNCFMKDYSGGLAIGGANISAAALLVT